MEYAYYWGLLLLLLSGAAQAQQRPYWPLLRPGLLYQLSEPTTPGDTTHTVRLAGPGQPAGPDSSYRFNQQVVAIRPVAGLCYRTHAGRPNRLFGTDVVVSGTEAGTYTLRAGSSSLLLRLRQPVGAVWAATPTGLTARVTARGPATVLGQPDSVVTVALSSGQLIRVGKRYGWLEGPAPADLLRNLSAPRQLLLTALPQLSLGTPAIGDWAVFNFQPNDAFLRYYRQETYQGMTCEESWRLDSVLTRTLSPDGNTLTYNIWRRTVTRRYGSPGAPMGFCGNTPGTTVSAPQVYTQQVSRLGSGQLLDLSNTAAAGSGLVPVAGRSYTTAHFQGRKVQVYLGRFACPNTPPDSTWLGQMPDVSKETSYAVGLGQVLERGTELSGLYSTTLLAYRKMPVGANAVPETWGSLRIFDQVLASEQKRPLPSTAAFPTPFTQELTLRFTAPRSQTATVLLFDALGRQVLRQEHPAAAGTATELRLGTAALPAGVYGLHLLREGRTEVLKVVKGQ